jgi:2-polyprenyl-6-hydroxyphenyl methylase/3-demethylubiquinone-9 3-methyltransferase
MNQHWHVTDTSLQIESMPFYWRLSDTGAVFQNIKQRLPIRVRCDERFDFLKYEPTTDEWASIEAAYFENENIGFLNPASGQLDTYGTSVNNFFLAVLSRDRPKRIYEIGCGAGHTITYLKKHGFNVTGIDPSLYSRAWSEQLGFPLVNEFFSRDLLNDAPDFIYCNDVFEHIRDPFQFSQVIFDSLASNGTFCIATTNSTRSIEIGDISILEHQHVNMFTERSIRLLLQEAGFHDIEIQKGTYGNTFHVIARKQKVSRSHSRECAGLFTCKGYFERANQRIRAFGTYYAHVEQLHAYVPLRCIPYLATVGDFGASYIYDSNAAWRNKYIDGYSQLVRGLHDVKYDPKCRYFIGSLTFYDEIRRSLNLQGCPSDAIDSIESIGKS